LGWLVKLLTLSYFFALNKQKTLSPLKNLNSKDTEKPDGGKYG
jgi:hypothetical protein